MIKQKGHVLVFVMMISSLCTLVCLCMWQSYFIQVKFHQNVQFGMDCDKYLVNEMNSLEQSYDQDWLNKHAIWQGFVPDTLQFGEHEGLDVYAIEIERDALCRASLVEAHRFS